ncbi:MAG: metallophosphoesterase [Spirochaetia bacterium]|nr:metallophosphoesterase [Spirochaetia bacterium]
MEIVYLTDIHDDLKSLRQVLLNTDPDLYVISGDLIYKAFFTDKLLYEFVYIQEEFFAYLIQNDIQGTPSELAVSISRMPENYPVDFLKKAKDYQILFQKASENMKAKYQLLKYLVDRYARAELIVLPGNYDLDLQFTALYLFDLHKKCRTIKGVKFCGYGGAPVATSGIPEMVSVVFYEYNVEGKIHSEPQVFFESSKPDIVLLHNPAYGTLDKIASYGRVGSLGIRNYIDQYQPALVLSGHVHSDYGIVKIDKTICINPSNFGKVDSLGGHESGGFFCRIFVENGKTVKVNSVKLHRIVDKHIIDVADFFISPELNIKTKILNQQEFDKLGGFVK